MKLAWSGGVRARSGESGGLVTSIGVGVGSTTVVAAGASRSRGLFGTPSIAVLPMGTKEDPNFFPSGRARLHRG